MKRSILTITLAASLLALAPALHARDHDHGDDDFRSDIHSLWDWYGHLNDEANAHGGHRVRDELGGIRGDLEHVDHEMHDGHYHNDRVRGELDGIKDNLRRVNDELHWHGHIDHRPGFVIEFR
jgi:hypothetical protein